jgi:hypothetical protein
MAIEQNILRFFADEICKIAMPALKVPGMGRNGEQSSLTARPAHAQAGNLAKAQKALKTPPSGMSNSAANTSSLKTIGATGSVAPPPPPPLSR